MRCGPATPISRRPRTAGRSAASRRRRAPRVPGLAGELPFATQREDLGTAGRRVEAPFSTCQPDMI